MASLLGDIGVLSLNFRRRTETVESGMSSKRVDGEVRLHRRARAALNNNALRPAERHNDDLKWSHRHFRCCTVPTEQSLIFEALSPLG